MDSNSSSPDRETFQKIKSYLKKEFLRTSLFLKKVFRNPAQEIVQTQGFSWTEILFSYLVITTGFYLVIHLFVFPISLLGFQFFLPLSNSFTALIIQSFLLLLVGYVLQALKYSVSLKDLSEAWLVVWTLTLALLTPLSIFSMRIFPEAHNLSIAVSVVAFAALGFLFYLALVKRFSLPRRTAAWTAIALSLFFFLQPLQSWWSLRGLNQFGASSKEINHLQEALSELAKTQATLEEAELSDLNSDFDPIMLSDEVLEYAEQRSGGDPKKKGAILQKARAYEMIAQQKLDHEAAYDNSSKASGCVDQHFGIDLAIHKTLESLVFDTPKKMRAYIEYNRALSGKVLPMRLSRPEDCHEY